MSNRGSLQVDRVPSAGEGTVLRLVGVIDEHADLSFFRHLEGRVTLNLRQLRRINSFGVRAWVDGLSTVPAGTGLQLEECPPPFVDQLNMLTTFRGAARVASFLAPYMCPACDHEQDHRIVVSDLVRRGYALPDDVRCEQCGEPMEFDGLEAMYLRFLRAEGA